MLKHIFLFFTAALFWAVVYGQSDEYDRLIGKADSLYQLKHYKEAAFTYSLAFKANKGNGEIKDRYCAAGSWAMANNADSAFKYLQTLTTAYRWSNKDSTFMLLQNDKRWQDLFKKNEDNFKEPNVGDILFDGAFDNPNFYLCNSKAVEQYYAVGTNYKGDKKALKQYFFDNFKPTGKQNGFITIRFVVNCKGETDRFRISQLDRSYNPVVFDTGLTDKLLKLTKGLKDWIQPKHSKVAYDSYYYLCFKLENGLITTITP